MSSGEGGSASSREHEQDTSTNKHQTERPRRSTVARWLMESFVNIQLDSMNGLRNTKPRSRTPRLAAGRLVPGSWELGTEMRNRPGDWIDETSRRARREGLKTAEWDSESHLFAAAAQQCRQNSDVPVMLQQPIGVHCRGGYQQYVGLSLIRQAESCRGLCPSCAWASEVCGCRRHDAELWADKCALPQ